MGDRAGRRYAAAPAHIARALAADGRGVRRGDHRRRARQPHGRRRYLREPARPCPVRPALLGGRPGDRAEGLDRRHAPRSARWRTGVRRGRRLARLPARGPLPQLLVDQGSWRAVLSGLGYQRAEHLRARAVPDRGREVLALAARAEPGGRRDHAGRAGDRQCPAEWPARGLGRRRRALLAGAPGYAAGPFASVTLADWDWPAPLVQPIVTLSPGGCSSSAACSAGGEETEWAA